MKRPFPFQPYHQQSTASLVGLVLFFLLFLGACGREGEAPASPEETPLPPVQQQGELLCSDECAARGQCGSTPNDEQKFILGHPEFPAVSGHQMTFPTDHTLPILGTQSKLVQELSSKEQFMHTFFLIRREDERTGWVAGWCLNPQ
ncbi:MAG: hypothetical protein CSB13_08085 [Chloroflexi bacterium]|nr:MAG: hypothetical protein CSB13_08085 [Chloroflexota bacterium]